MIKKWFKPIAFVLVLAVLIPPVVGYGVFRRLQSRLKLKIQGQYAPVLFLPEFKVKNASFRWEDKVELMAGDIRVEYRPLSVFWGDNLCVKVSGAGVKVKLLGSWAAMQGVQDSTVETFEADLGISAKGLKEILGVEIVSPQFQFRIKKSDK